MIVRTRRREDTTKNRSWILRPNNTAGVVRNVVTTLLLVSALVETTKISRTTTMTALAFTPPLPSRHQQHHPSYQQQQQQQNPSCCSSRRPIIPPTRLIASSSSPSLVLASSFFGKFEEEDFDEDEDDEYDEEEDEDDDEDEYDNLDDKTVADFRTRMASLFDDSTNTDDDDDDDEDQSIADELLLFSSFPTDSASSTTPKEWAEPATVVREGCILAANPQAFCSDFGRSSKNAKKKSSSISPQLLSKFGLTLPPPADLGADRRADLLPVLVVVEYDAASQRARAVLLNRRTGYLLGDLEQQQQQQQPPPSSTSSDSSSTASSSSSPTPLLEKFCIQPLWFGGVDSGGSSSNGGGGGLDMLHLCPTVAGARPITPDGLFWGGDPAQAQDAMSDPSLERVFTGFDFKFFVQSTAFGPGELQRELEKETFFCATVSKEILFKSRDRMGTRRAKPLWTEIMELMGGEYQRVRDRLYGMDRDDEEEEGPQGYL